MREQKSDVASIYVGETGRSIFERSKEHWDGARKGDTSNHMVKHQSLEHGGRKPQFIMKLVKQFRTPLNRQVAEAIRIRRRGGEGAILNSKGEYSRCHIPRLRIEEEELEEEKQEREGAESILREHLIGQDQTWELEKTRELGGRAILGPGASPVKRTKDPEDVAPRTKKRQKTWKYPLLEEGWEEQTSTPVLS